ncbi:MAG: hypothetical protein ACPHHQ_09275, partial [Pseudomonadales bacterium]
EANPSQCSDHHGLRLQSPPHGTVIGACYLTLNASNGNRMETNSLTTGIKDGRARVAVLRGYL